MRLLRLILGLSFILMCGAVVFAVIAFVPRYNTGPSLTSPPPLISIITHIPSTILSRLSLTPRKPEDHSLIAVMIENHEDARPHHRGLEQALLIEEFLVEGFISRFIALFPRDHLPEIIGPVRSLRPYFIHGILPWASAVFYAGGSPEALEEAENDETVATINGLAYEPSHFSRDLAVPAPHNLFLSTENLSLLLSPPKNIYPWPPYLLDKAPTASGATTISINFLSPLHNVVYTFSPFTGRYTRKNGSTISAATPANILILQMPITDIKEFGRLTIPVEGSGEALFFRSGITVHSRWSKTSRMSPFQFSDDEGNSLPFAEGQTWITVLPELSRVTWEE